MKNLCFIWPWKSSAMIPWIPRNPGFFLHHRTIFGHKNPGGSWDLRIILLQDWAEQYILHIQHETCKGKIHYIYIYTHIFWTGKNNDFSIADFGWCCWFHPPKSMPHVMEKNSEMRTVQGAVDFQGSETTRICRHVEPQIVLAWRGPARAWGSVGISWWGGHWKYHNWLWCRCSPLKGHFGMWSSTENLGWVKPPNVPSGNLT